MKWLLNIESGVEFSERIKQTNIKGFFQYQLIHIGDNTLISHSSHLCR